MANMDLLSTCPQCRGVWLTSTMQGGYCHVCSGHREAALRRAQLVKTTNVVHKHHVALHNEAKRGIKKAGHVSRMLEGETRRL